MKMSNNGSIQGKSHSLYKGTKGYTQKRIAKSVYITAISTKKLKLPKQNIYTMKKVGYYYKECEN